MPATPQRVDVTEEDIAKKERGPQSGSYAAIVVPADYVATLKDVSDHTGPKGPGYKWTFLIEDCDFDLYTSLSLDARWKLLEVCDAFDSPLEAGTGVNIDPNVFVGLEAGAHVDWRFDPDTKPEKNFKEIKNVFSLAGINDPDDGMEEVGVSTGPDVPDTI